MAMKSIKKCQQIPNSQPWSRLNVLPLLLATIISTRGNGVAELLPHSELPAVNARTFWKTVATITNGPEVISSSSDKLKLYVMNFATNFPLGN